MLRTRFLRPLVQCGKYSLPVYCTSVLLSFSAHAILGMGWNNLASQTLVSIGGVAIMAAIAALLARSDRAADVVSVLVRHSAAAAYVAFVTAKVRH